MWQPRKGVDKQLDLNLVPKFDSLATNQFIIEYIQKMALICNLSRMKKIKQVLIIIDGQSVCCSSTAKLGGQANKECSVWI